ncbi:GNAT family N-acetyltransferase [Streptomyces olindensis]|uniref:GNAT family N-acetyltransferase n=1 Tax=Streptomyces olindensis TaxID=358823 RepID=UPI0033FD9672
MPHPDARIRTVRAEDLSELVRLDGEAFPQSDRRGRGLGRRLMLAALHRLGSDGAVEARLAVRPDDEAALGLHTSLGFVPEGDVRRDHYGPGEDRLLLRLGLEQQESGQVPGSTDTPAVAHSPGRRAAGPSCGEAGSVRRGRPGG